MEKEGRRGGRKMEGYIMHCKEQYRVGREGMAVRKGEVLMGELEVKKGRKRRQWQI